MPSVQTSQEQAATGARSSVSIADVFAAAKRIGPYAHRTPVLTSATLDSMASAHGTPIRLFFKCELFQRVGAFKFRGACNAVMKLSDEVAARGVVTHSSGNHAQALALAARLRGIPAHIVMPRNSSAVKIRAVEGYGGRITLCEPNQESREGTAQRIAKETGATLIPPYNHPDIIAGQGTLALELLEQVRDMAGRNTCDAVVAPIGGGGMISGVCIATKGIDPTIAVFAAEPAGADDAARSKAENRLVPQTEPKTIADGLLTSMGDLTWPIVRDNVNAVITVSEEEIIAAMRLVWERMKILIEPSSAVAVAVAISSRFSAALRQDRRAGGGPYHVGVVLSGGNVDLDRLPWVVQAK